jgi:hypothetical protein
VTLSSLLVSATQEALAVEDDLDRLRARNLDLEQQVAELKAQLAEAQPVNVWSGRFDESWRTRFGVVAGTYDRTRIVTDPQRGTVLEAWVPALERQGFGVHMDFEKMGFRYAEDVTVEWDQWWPDDYPWSYSVNGVVYGGGKEPGLAGKVRGGNPQEVGSNGRYWPDGWSMRNLWLKDRGVQGFGALAAPKASNGSEWATPRWSSNGAQTKLSAGWHRLGTRCVMNTPGARDGLYEAFYDGATVAHVDTIAYRDADHPTLEVTQLYFGWFYGGPQADAPRRPATTRFDNVTITIN